MKFYKKQDYVPTFIFDQKLTAIYSHAEYVQFFKNGMYHNPKNADIIDNYGNKDFSLNDKVYGDQDKFTKKSWRRFVKLQAFL